MSNSDRLCWNPKSELVSDDEMKTVQLKKLRSMLGHVYRNSPFYRDSFREASLTPEDIKSLGDFYRRVPLTLKDDLRKMQAAQYPFGSNGCIPYNDVRLVTSSTGTTGKPTYTGFSAKDLEMTKEVVKRSFWLCGLRAGDVYLHAFAISNWIAGIPVVDAAMEMGLVCLPVGVPTPAQRMITMIQDQRPTAMSCTPSYAIHLAEKVLEILGKEASELGIRKMTAGGEPGAGIPHIREQIQRSWGADVRDVLGTPEQIPYGWAECRMKQGMHALNRDFILNELVDPETKEHIEMSEGAEGALVYTAIDRECAPLMRFYVADHVKVFTEPCECGYPGFRLTVLGRYDDLLKIRGVKTWPTAIRDALTTLSPAVTGEFRIVLSEKPLLFTVNGPVKLVVEQGPDVSPQDLPTVKGKITNIVQSVLGWTPDEVEMVPAGTLLRPEFKARYVEVKS